MIRIFILFLVVLAAGLGAAWLADQSGSVVLTWQGSTIETSLTVAVVAVFGLAAAIAVAWGLLRFLLRIPSLIALSSRARKRSRGFGAVSRGMIAVGAGDPAGARRYAGEARKLLGEEPLTLLLEAQAAQLSGDRAGAQSAFRTMIDNDDTRVLGLRGLFIEARRTDDEAGARQYATEAARIAPAASWANEAVLADACAAGDWATARATLDRAERLRVLDKATSRRQRAVVSIAQAMSLPAARSSEALSLALEAHKLAPELTPAAVFAGRMLAQAGEFKKASKILETAYKATPHPDLASAYVDVRSGDSVQDRLARARTLSKLRIDSPESAIMLARVALEARDTGAAREALAPLLSGQPTARVALLMARIEEMESGPDGAARMWLKRAAIAPRDAAWVADGVVHDRWMPVSPLTNRLDAFVWMVPPQRLSALPAIDLDDVLADGHENEPIFGSKPEGAMLDAPVPEVSTPELPMRDAPHQDAPTQDAAAAPAFSRPDLAKPDSAEPDLTKPILAVPTSAIQTGDLLQSSANRVASDPASGSIDQVPKSADTAPSVEKPAMQPSAAHARPGPAEPAVTGPSLTETAEVQSASPSSPSAVEPAARIDGAKSDVAREIAPEPVSVTPGLAASPEPVPAVERAAETTRGTGRGGVKPVIFPIARAPDDPGAEAMTPRKPGWKLFG